VLAAASLMAKGGVVEVYGIVDKVTFEPNEITPTRVKVWGAFALTPPGDWRSPTANNSFGKPEAGYLYFKLPAGVTAEVAKKQWNDLKALAGSGKAIGFGRWDVNYWGAPKFDHKETGFVLRTNPPEQESLRVHAASEKDAKPVTYSIDTGIVTLQNSGNYSTLTTMLKVTLKH